MTQKSSKFGREGEEAAKRFLKKKGYRGFRVTGKNGEKGEQMDEFDPAAGRMIMIPPLQGG